MFKPKASVRLIFRNGVFGTQPGLEEVTSLGTSDGISALLGDPRGLFLSPGKRQVPAARRRGLSRTDHLTLGLPTQGW